MLLYSAPPCLLSSKSLLIDSNESITLEAVTNTFVNPLCLCLQLMVCEPCFVSHVWPGVVCM